MSGNLNDSHGWRNVLSRINDEYLLLGMNDSRLTEEIKTDDDCVVNSEVKFTEQLQFWQARQEQS